MEEQAVEGYALSRYLLTYLWVAMESLAAILLFDGFSERKRRPGIHWLIAACFTLLEATALNLLDPGMVSLGKVLYGYIAVFLLHRILYQGSLLFGLYITIIYYATMSCVDNLCATFAFWQSGATTAIDLSNQVLVSIFIHFIQILVFYLHSRIRKSKVVATASWKWYTVPALLSLISILLVSFFGTCFQNGQMATLPLFVCAGFITFLQTAAMFLISWMEQNAHFREETLSLQTKAQAQQESIEALSAAYAQQRKMTHDFQAHLDMLAGILAQNPLDTSELQKYVQGLRAAQTDRILLVNTHHAALDALLNQKALVAKNRKIDIQFSVNDLSAVKINMVDLTILISNTLDNAIEACEKLPDDDRRIFVQVLLEEDVLFYAVRNRSLPVNVQPGQLPVTTKIPPSLHGYGLENVRTTLKKYSSLYAINYADGWFGFATDLPNTLIS